MTAHLPFLIFFFVLGSCVGSFLNVVVWRLPRVTQADDEKWYFLFYRSLQALSDPPSHCPRCEKTLKWYDNIPVIGWIKLGGKCRFCKEPFSIRYPIVEGLTGLLFAGYYAAFFIFHVGPCAHVMANGRIVRPALFLFHDWWIYGLDMVLLSGLLAASLIDAELFLIPMEIPWLIVPVAIAAHAVFDRGGSGSVAVSAIPAALGAGAGLGAVISFVLLVKGVLPESFSEGPPMTESEREEIERERRKQEKKKNKGSIKTGKNPKPPDPAEEEPPEYTPAEVRREIRKEMLFLLPPLAMGMLFVLLAWKVGPVARWWVGVTNHGWVAAMLGSVLGGLVGGFVVWFTRILGSLGFGREAMGMGDVDLMVAVGAVLGAGPATVAFFLAPFFGILVALYMLIMRRKRELPYGPYLSLSTAFVMLFYCPIAAYFAPGLSAMADLAARAVGGGG